MNGETFSTYEIKKCFWLGSEEQEAGDTTCHIIKGFPMASPNDTTHIASLFFHLFFFLRKYISMALSCPRNIIQNVCTSVSLLLSQAPRLCPDHTALDRASKIAVGLGTPYGLGFHSSELRYDRLVCSEASQGCLPGHTAAPGPSTALPAGCRNAKYCLSHRVFIKMYYYLLLTQGRIRKKKKL